LKQLTGGDPITARFMRQDFFTYYPIFKLTIVGNHEPTLKSVDDAARRRFNVAPFIHKPKVVDKKLPEKLRAEWPGILRWMINGCLAWQRDGLAPPKAVQVATQSYFESQDVFTQWLEEKCSAKPGDRSKSDTSANLFASWSAYAKAAGEPPGTRKAFARMLERAGFEPYRKLDRARTRAYYGLYVVPPPNEYGDSED
jgi:putative DNA primase/helicase